MTMLLAAALLGLQAEAASTPPPSEEEIVIIGERMRRLKLATKTDRKTGLTRCVFKRRSGDAAFDAMMCDAVLACAKTVTTQSQMEGCIAPRLESYARDLERRRKAGGTAAAP